ncbi:MAG: ribosome maturation factor RimM [Hyphomicrobiales bacterium]
MAAPVGAPGNAGLIRVGEIGGAHGVGGELRLRSFAATPSDIAAYSPLLAADGRPLVVSALRPIGGAPDMFIARIAGVASREAAQALAGTALYVPRERIAAGLGEQEYLHADLIGCRVETEGGRAIGEVVAVQNFGAGDLIEIALDGPHRTELVPFAERFVPVVDLAGRRIVIADASWPSADLFGGSARA